MPTDLYPSEIAKALARTFPDGPPYPKWLEQALDEPEGPGIDPEVITLCAAMNDAPGIRTVESCCGHGREPFRIYFDAESLDALVPVAYAADGCHSGCYGWQIVAITDCGMSPISFKLEGSKMWAASYREADKIAVTLREASREYSERAGDD